MAILFILLVSIHSYFMKVDPQVSIIIMVVSFTTSAMLLLTVAMLKKEK